MNTKSLAVLVCLLMTLASVCLLASPARAETPKKVYRGFTVCSMDDKTLGDAANVWGANQVRYMMCPVWRRDQRQDLPTCQAAWNEIVTNLPAELDRAHKLGLAVVLDLHQIPNDNPAKYPDDEKQASRAWWQDESNLKVMLECWRQLATITAERPDQKLWLEILNEPLDLSLIHI